MERHKAEEKQLNCNSEGWFPQPHVHWRDREERTVPTDPAVLHKGHHGLFHVESYLLVTNSSVVNVACSIINLPLGEEKTVAVSLSVNMTQDVNTAHLQSILPGEHETIVTHECSYSQMSHRALTASCTPRVRLGSRQQGGTEIWDDRKAQFENGWQNSYLYPDWRKKYYQAANVTLDPDTAHPALILSEERRRVAMGEKPQDLPRSQLRFESLPCVLGQQSFSSERHFWEVKVDSSTAWDLGICQSDVKRKEKTYIKPEDGFWAIRFYNNDYWALTSPKTQLTLKEHPCKVCIFLDYEGGRVSFYNMTDNSHIHTFSQGAFSGSLRPFFRLWSKDKGHLDICPLTKE
nr:butyrophilin subfamily 1 member A1-like [Cavia porcellus]